MFVEFTKRCTTVTSLGLEPLVSVRLYKREHDVVNLAMYKQLCGGRIVGASKITREKAQ